MYFQVILSSAWGSMVATPTNNTLILCCILGNFILAP